MGCGCKDRGKMLVSAARQLKQGNMGQAIKRTQAVAQSARQDAQRAAQRIAAGARLGRR